jgi:DNA-binding NtrC family response regulator
LADLMIALTDGISLVEQLRQQNPDLPVIIMTGFGTLKRPWGRLSEAQKII